MFKTKGRNGISYCNERYYGQKGWFFGQWLGYESEYIIGHIPILSTI